MTRASAAPGPVAPCTHAALCVLSSSSRGNSSVLLLGDGDARKLILIDAGLSPRRTRSLLARVGLAGRPIDAVILTHLDTDHWHAGWLAALPESTPVYLHKRHRGRAQREGQLHRHTRIFESDFDPVPGVRVAAMLHSHDSLGCASFRFELEDSNRALGFATDLGRASDMLIEHLSGVDVLAIESNYCPRMQLASNRPLFLKRRIMGGHGHLSNEQSAELIRAIGPREHVVLLHLSLQCNQPALAAAHHADAPYSLTIAPDAGPTPWIPIAWPGAPAAPRHRRTPKVHVVQSCLWQSAEP